MSERWAFFRQTGWMVAATTLGGLFMWLVHVPAAAGMPHSEYGVFVTLLQVMNLMMIPAMGLQTIFAQQAAAAVDEARTRELRTTVRQMTAGMFGLWLLAAFAIAAFSSRLIAMLQIANPAALWLTVGIGLAMLWWPILQGVLQGRQNFLWLGWLQIINGLTRFLGVLFFVTWLGWHAAGAMSAAFLGFWAAVAIAVWQTRDTLRGPGGRVAWKRWLSKAVPLSFGLGTSQFMMAADQIAVQSQFDKELTGFYGAAGMIGRALVFFTVPLVAVMFPKVVRSHTLSQRTSVAAQALGATALLGGGAALVCTLFPALPLRIVYFSKPEYLTSAPLVPWFAWCMLPLTFSNVLIGNLLGKERFRAVPWLVLVAAAYGIALAVRTPIYSQAASPQEGFLGVIRTLGFFSALLFAVAAWFTWGPPARGEASPPKTDAGPASA
ncbi:MAG: hypothetical protein J7M29_12135 [Verrucomicrobia bacterium]|nr:hypothetical protein [Verrucomicrobiota bacterium]